MDLRSKIAAYVKHATSSSPAPLNPVDWYLNGGISGWKILSQYQFQWDGVSDYYILPNITITNNFYVMNSRQSDWHGSWGSGGVALSLDQKYEMKPSGSLFTFNGSGIVSVKVFFRSYNWYIQIVR